MALAMSWLTFAGLKGPLGDDARQPGFSLDTDDTDAAEQRDDEPVSNTVGVQDGRSTVQIGGWGVQSTSPAPTAAPAGNYPSTDLKGRDEPVQDDGEAPVAEASTTPASAPSRRAAKKSANAPAAKPKASTGEKMPTAASASKAAPNKSKSAPKTYVVQQVPESDSVKIDKKDEPDTWDDLGDFLGFFNPFFAYVPAPAYPPELTDDPHESSPDVGQTSQPDRLDQLQAVKLPTPVTTDAAPEAFAG
ncbi:hypothetical protein NX794_07435 [Streptomyces sp. LP11]|uniref:Secreted protein n=1 Tax=Streptomyces pyxinicus TaxID=2970331 RepID=A0ABT2AXU9_9ACTN|nr:hypothetical protein [Streptomyces sp. LP11]MCS0601062.1 hypothetical protein [Streptomyces sp. LP11]